MLFRSANGAGLAANQIYAPIQICAIEVGNNPRYPYKPKIPLTVLVNPVLEPLDAETFPNYEGCLSVPDLRGMVRRHSKLELSGYGLDGKPFKKIYEGFPARVVQHETDHLNGLVYLDRMDGLKTLAYMSEMGRRG